MTNSDWISLLDLYVLASVWKSDMFFITCASFFKWRKIEFFRANCSIINIVKWLWLVKHSENNVVSFHESIFVQGAVGLSVFIFTLFCVVASKSVASNRRTRTPQQTCADTNLVKMIIWVCFACINQQVRPKILMRDIWVFIFHLGMLCNHSFPQIVDWSFINYVESCICGECFTLVALPHMDVSSRVHILKFIRWTMKQNYLLIDCNWKPIAYSTRVAMTRIALFFSLENWTYFSWIDIKIQLHLDRHVLRC